MHMRAAARAPFTRIPARMVSLAWADALAFIQANPVPVLSSLAAAVVLGLVLLKLSSSSGAASSGAPFLDPTQFKPMRLVDKAFITHNTLRMRFALAHPSQRLGLPIGQHMSFLGQGADGKDVYRSYTPVSDDGQLGAVDFVIKVYPTGKMTQILNKLQVGQTIMVKGPKGRMQYTPNMKQHIGMLAGGTGVTPMYQVLNAILKNPKDKTKATLLFGNLTADDILLRGELESLVQQHPDRLKVVHVLNTPPKGWSGGSGFITADLIRAHLPPPGPGTLVLRCGPLPMCEAMKQHLDALGYAEDAQFQF